VSRRAPNLDLAPLLGAMADEPADEITTRILDAAASVLETSGLRRCTVEEIAERGNVGRTTIYRRFDGRDEIVHAVLARELRTFLLGVAESVAHLDRLEDKLVEGFLRGVRTAEDTLLVPLMRREPDLLMFVVGDAAPIMQLVTGLLVAELRRHTGVADEDRARHGAEILFRLAVSFVLMPSSTLPLADEAAARTALHQLFDPFLASALGTGPSSASRA